MASRVMISLVVAMDQARAIGLDGAMPWHLPADLSWFKQLTLGKPVLMGRATALSIGRSLPGRPNLVLSRREAPAPFEGQRRVASLEAALQACREAGDGELMVIGGGQVYAQCIELADRIHMSCIATRVPAADTFFPPIEAAAWRELSRRHHPADARHAWDFDMISLERIRGRD